MSAKDNALEPLMPKAQLVEETIKQEERKIIEYRKYCMSSLYLFNKYVLAVGNDENKMAFAPFHKEICDFVQTKRDRKKIILVPRGHLKSTLITIGYSVFRIVEDRNVRILILNATWQMAVDFLTEIKNQLQKNETLLEVFGDYTQKSTEWSQDRITLNRDPGIKGPTVWAAGVDSNLVGSHPDVIIMDDLVNRDIVESEDMSAKAKLRYKDALDLLEPGGQLIIIGTRWSDSDLYEWILNPENHIVESFDKMIKPAFETDFDLNTVFGTGDESMIRNHLWPQKFNFKELKDRYREKGPYEFSCTPAETPILMANWETKMVCDIRAGDSVVGWTRGDVKNNGKLKPVVVKRTFSKIDDIYCLEMASGRKVFCTKDHRWYTGRLDKTHKQYNIPKIGRKLQYVCPSESPIKFSDYGKWQYLAGIFDGEGSSTSGGCLEITQGLGRNLPVTEKIKTTLKDLGLKYGEYIKTFKDHQVSQMWIKDNFNTHLKLIRNTDLAKKYQLINNLYRRGTKFIKEEDRVLDIKFIRRDTVYALETETGNYIAWGYASSNSQYLNDPVPDEAADFHKDWFHYMDLEEWRGRKVNVNFTVDPAISLKKEADFTGIVGTKTDQFGFIVPIYIGKFKIPPDQLIKLLFWIGETFHPDTIGIEMVAFQKVLQYSINEEMRRRGHSLPIVELKTQDRSKDERIRALQPLYANGKILHSKQVPGYEILEDELLRFPRGKHDDVIDAMASQLDLIVAPVVKKSRYHNHYLYGNNKQSTES